MKTSTPRLHSVRFKNGGEVRALPPIKQSDMVRSLMSHVREVVEVMGETEIAAFAVVAIGMDNSTTCGINVIEGSPVGVIMMPSVVHDMLVRRILWGDLE